MAIGLDDVVLDYGFWLVILRDVNVSGIAKHSCPFSKSLSLAATVANQLSNTT
jgi:hypothetical protein